MLFFKLAFDKVLAVALLVFALPTSHAAAQVWLCDRGHLGSREQRTGCFFTIGELAVEKDKKMEASID